MSGHPAGPYRAVNSQQQLVSRLHEGVDTLDKVFEFAVRRFPQRDCLGTREVLSEEDEVQPNGKVFKKVRHEQYTLCMYQMLTLSCFWDYERLVFWDFVCFLK